MPIDLKAVLADKAKFPDDYVVKIGDESVPLGTLRGLSAETQAALAQQKTDLDRRQAQLMTDIDALRSAQTKTAELYARLQADATAAVRTNPAADANDPFAALTKAEEDPFLKPIVSAIRAIQSQVNTGLSESLKKIETTQQQMAIGYIQDKIDDNYERLGLTKEQEAKFPVDHLARYANEHKLFTRTGVPDVRKAFKELTAADTEAAKIEKARQDGIAEGERKAAEAANKARTVVARPGSPFGLSQPPTALKPGERVQTIDEAVRAAYGDADIWKTIDGQPLQ